MRVLRWIARLIEDRKRRRLRREFAEMRDCVEYLADQVAAIDIEIVGVHAEMEGLIHTRNILAARRDTFAETIHQTEALYRSA